MAQWIRASLDLLTNLFYLPLEIALSNKYSFYTPLGFQIDRFQLLCFRQLDEHNNYINFRFWSLEDDLLKPGVDILADIYSGNISLQEEQAESLIGILENYAEELKETELNASTFHLILPQDYDKYHIDRRVVSEKRKIYVCVSEPDVDNTNGYKLLSISFDKSLYIKIVLMDKGNPKTFNTSWSNPEGGLNLTKQAIKELCEILSSNFIAT